MTTKQASVRFNIDEREIRKRNKDGMIMGVTKEHGFLIIPDETKLIPSKADVKAFLFQILKFKNNQSIVLAQNMFPDVERLKIFAEFLFLKGYIGRYDDFCNEKDFLNAVQITDIGMQLVFGNNVVGKLSMPITVNFAPSVNVKLLHV